MMRRWTMVLSIALGVIAMAACSDDTSTKTDASVADQRLEGLPQSDGRTPDQTLPADGTTPADGATPADGTTPADAVVPADCPKSEPTAGLACAQTGKQCGYGSGPECGNVWECFGGKWALAFQGTNCASVPPAGCSATKPTGFCTLPSGPCRYDDVVCSCVNVCSGVQPPPGQEYVWACATPRTVACPSTTPTQASACTSEGLVCHYGNCGGATATCTSGKWNVVMQPPPP